MNTNGRQNRRLAGIICIYALVWIATAIAPRDPSTWLLENLLVFLFVGLLAISHRRLALSNLSYLLIAIFLSLHAVGAHTGYAHSPVGTWLQSALGLRRNYYDRVIHFSFGLLLAYPLRDLLVRFAGVNKLAGDWYAVCLIMAASTVFEITEWNIAEIVSPGAGPDWLGAQGDEWDSQQDMLAALVGAILTVLVTWCSDHPPSPRSVVAPPAAGPPGERRLLHVYGALYLLAWVLAAIDPVSRSDWVLENLLAVLSVIFLIASYRRRPLSDLSYSLIFVFFLLHTTGAHYTYAQVPLGFWLQDAFSLTRNHFDRIVHFAFGLLLTIPLADLLRVERLHRFWELFLPVAVVIAVSGMFEIIEAIVAWIVNPDLGQAYLGTQGDQWDAQKDMALAAAGALLAAFACYGFAPEVARRGHPARPAPVWPEDPQEKCP